MVLHPVQSGKGKRMRPLVVSVFVWVLYTKRKTHEYKLHFKLAY